MKQTLINAVSLTLNIVRASESSCYSHAAHNDCPSSNWGLSGVWRVGNSPVFCFVVGLGGRYVDAQCNSNRWHLFGILKNYFSRS